ncbi:MAG: adenylyltransferase/cytidyltransferase family protein [Candidatus Brockarchaeota archaeon]|nr:adenylyltransferase/cytidyltransferase family protein [Candidatus Brockarchaeota archaeon]
MSKGGRVVLTTGVFDIIHPGHIRFLEEAKKLAGRGGKLVVIVACDSVVRESKGRRPMFKARDRALMISRLKPVDTVYVGRRGRIEKNIPWFLKKIKPDILVFGYDQESVMKSTLKIMDELGLKIRVVRMRKFYNISSSKIIRRIKKS